VAHIPAPEREKSTVPESLSIVPAPRHAEEREGNGLELAVGIGILVGPGPREIALGVYASQLAERIGLGSSDLLSADDGRDRLIELRLDPQAGPTDCDPSERYDVTVDSRRALVRAPTVVGLYYGLVTLRQTVRTRSDGSVFYPPMHVEDAPRYAWRGLGVDVARHFFSVEDLQVLIGLMGNYKLNMLHLHLTDDQGWRLDIPSRPLLAERSAGTAVDRGRGGYFTADEYLRLVSFAATRGITVVPEIDIPGHVNAALHAYGELTPSGLPTHAYTGTDVGISRLYADLPATGPFLRDVFSDLVTMTAGRYVHIGGDEASADMEPAEYARLVGLVSDVVAGSGKTVVGWQEVAQVPLEPGSIVQVWDLRMDPEPLIAAAARGCRILMSPGSKAYLDMKYDAGYPRGLDWAGYTELRDAYDWDPATLVPGLPPESVIGVEAVVWTETLSTVDELTEMLLPRLSAVAEVAWSVAAERSWESYRHRIASHREFWNQVGVRWYPTSQVDW
jgi:hexosaminidase